MRRRIIVATAAIGLAIVTVTGLQAAAAGDEASFSARLNGFREIPTLSVRGSGQFSAEIAADGDSISYTLTYRNLTGPALFAHVHLGKPWVAAGVIAFLCGGGGQDPCPGASGTVTGTITADDVVGPEDQGIAPGEFDELVRAMRAGATYVNVHTDAYPTGEIRGQIG
jgi:hypothetical protein